MHLVQKTYTRLKMEDLAKFGLMVVPKGNLNDPTGALVVPMALVKVGMFRAQVAASAPFWTTHKK